MARTKKTEVENIVEDVEKVEEEAPKSKKTSKNNSACHVATN